MASQQDLQELLRIITARKVPMMTAMSHVKALQAVNLRRYQAPKSRPTYDAVKWSKTDEFAASIQQIADAEADMVESALGDAKTAKSLQSACRNYVNRPSKKRASESLAVSTDRKRARTGQNSGIDVDSGQVSPEEAEDALSLPVVEDEDDIAGASIYTNRAPLMLAFVVELLRFTMPKQPLSSRLSLAQAVVAANSKNKAASIGLVSAIPEDGSWGEGQPKVTVMGRSVPVLKRGDYGSTKDGTSPTLSTNGLVNPQQAEMKPAAMPQTGQSNASSTLPSWSTSQQITYKSSTFVARVATLDECSQAPTFIRSLLSSEPSLQMATHNAWGCRVDTAVPDGATGLVREACEDDGETGCGEFILRLMRESGVVGAVVVLTRWFGGEMLGFDRWRIIRNCITDALSGRLRLCQREIGGDGVALWALDLQSMSERSSERSSYTQKPKDLDRTIVGAMIYQPEAARAYLLKNFTTGPSAGEQTHQNKHGVAAPKSKREKRSKSNSEAENLRNLGRLLGALRLLFQSWIGHMTRLEMDRRAWSWYVAVRPEIESGPAGWGAKGWVNLSAILHLRRGENSSMARHGGKGTGGAERGNM